MYVRTTDFIFILYHHKGNSRRVGKLRFKLASGQEHNRCKNTYHVFFITVFILRTLVYVYC